MSHFFRVIYNTRCICKKAGVLRLCNTISNNCYAGYITHRAFTAFQKTPQRCRHPIIHRTCTSVQQKEKVTTNNSVSNNEELNEHHLMHMTLENSLLYKETLVPPIKVKMDISNEEAERLLEIDWSMTNDLDVLSAFKRLMYHRMNNSKAFNVDRYNNVLDNLRKNVSSFDDQSLKTILQYLKPLKGDGRASKSYVFLMQSINKECLKRFFSSVNDMLLICDMFYNLVEMDHDFFWRSIRKLGSKVNTLSPNQFVQFVFYLSVYRLSQVNMYEVEHRFEQCIQDLSANEMGIVAVGFFKTRTKIKSEKLIRAIIMKLIDDIDNLDNINLSACMKLLRYSTKLSEISLFRILLSSITAKSSNLELMCLMNVSHACANILVYDEKLMNIVIQRLMDNLSQARLKDIERIVYSMSIICPDTSSHYDVYHKIIKDLEITCTTTRAEEIERFPWSLSRILSHLSYKNVYSQRLLEVVLSPTYINRMKHQMKGNLTRELWNLHHSISIDFPEYAGPQLNEKSINLLQQKYLVQNLYLNSVENKTLKLINEVAFMCKGVLKLDLYVGGILPHYTEVNVVLGFDEHDNPIATNPILSAIPNNTVKRVDSDELRKINWKVVLINTSTSIVKGSNEVTGLVKMKLRHLKRIGYTPIEIHEVAWNSLSSIDQKQDYVRNLIFNNNIDLSSQQQFTEKM